MRRTHSYRKEDIEDYSGGGGRGGVGTAYFYLVVNGKDKTVSVDHIQGFFKKGASLDEKSVFVFVDIATDKRMQQDLKARPGGLALYHETQSKAPVLLISSARLVNVDLETVELFPIKDFSKEMENIARRVGSLPPEKKSGALRFLKRLNEYVLLRPNVFGLGVDLNKVLSDVIERA
jgi:hypothetical protein